MNVDGMPVVWASRLLGKCLKERVAGVDLFEALVERSAAKGWRVFFLGAREEVVRAVKDLYGRMEWLVRRFSSVGQHQFFDPSQFAWISRIEAGWTAIRDELHALLRDRERIPSFEKIALVNTPGGVRDDKWKSYWLYA